MKIPKYLKDTVYQMSRLAKKQINLNRKLNKQLDKLGIDRDTDEFMWAFGYVEGDCSPEPLIQYLEEL
jgi:hypothetical protein